MRSTQSQHVLSDVFYSIIATKEKTAILVNRMSSQCTAAKVLELVDGAGFAGKYRSESLPSAFSLRYKVGVFVNFFDSSEAACCKAFLLDHDWPIKKPKIVLTNAMALRFHAANLEGFQCPSSRTSSTHLPVSPFATHVPESASSCAPESVRSSVLSTTANPTPEGSTVSTPSSATACIPREPSRRGTCVRAHSADSALLESNRKGACTILECADVGCRVVLRRTFLEIEDFEMQHHPKLGRFGLPLQRSEQSRMMEY